jgi:LmbE family N-acetylglucosaminyl deacetylase
MTALRRVLYRAALLLVFLQTVAPPAPAQLVPLPPDRGGNGLGLALRRLPVTGRVLYVTAHPDDEHNGVLVRLSRGLGLRTGLLTLTRGEGGQNAIGPELFDALGVLRTEELLALHRYDAVEQYFSRAYEFGYSFSVEETFAKWGREETLGDVVRIVRAFRPDVILTLPLEAGGGGLHHQASARLARDAFRAAADPARFPEQIRAGLHPWQARKIYQGGTGGFPEKIGGTPVRVSTGVYDPLLGMSWQEFGSLGRASHRCQGASQIKADPGPAEGVYYLVDSQPPATGPESDVLDGVDVSLKSLLRFLRPAEGKADVFAPALDALQAKILATQAVFDARSPEKAVPPLADALRTLRSLREATGGLSEAARFELDDRLGQEEKGLFAALALAQGLVFEARVDDGQVVPGQTFGVAVSLFNQGSAPVSIEGIDLRAPAGWTVRRTSGDPQPVLPGREGLRLAFAVTVGEKARYSQPYWHRRPQADRLDLDVPADETLPWSPPDITATLRYGVAGSSGRLEAPALWRYEGPFVGGEKQHVLQVVPALSVRLSPEIAIYPVGTTPRREFRVSVRNNDKGGAPVRVRLEAPPGFAVQPPEAPLAFRYEGEEIAARFFVSPPPGLREGEVALKAVAVRGGQEFREGVQAVAYDHIQERHLVRPAAARVLDLEVRTLPGTSVGYVMGSGDAGPDALRQLGLPVSLLGPDDLAYADLSPYTTIVTGIRAYEVREDLRSYHHRLMSYVEGGGHLVVQYNRAPFNSLPGARPPSAGQPVADSPFVPYPAHVTSNRITDETAPMKVLVPEHPLFTTPNRIGARDWEGWVQERGIQFLEARDPHYLELLAATDPFPLNPGEKKGILVEARVGRGTWTYVGLGLFRQLPAGTPGAYRILANLVSRPRAR